MMCSSCNSQPATVHYTESIQGHIHARSYCAACAQKMGILNMTSFPMDDVFKSFDNVLKSFDDAFKGFDIKTPTPTDITCSDCGMTLSKFRQTGRFGCAKDYELFKVGPALEKIHGASVHTGKVPEKSPEEKLKRLKKDMEAAVKAENYEKAASIRDEIRKLETT